MKKVLCSISVIVLAVCLAGCGDKKSSNDPTLYSISFDLAPVSGTASTVKVTDYAVFKKENTTYYGYYSTTGSTAVEFNFLESSVATLPANFPCISGTPNIYFDYTDENGDTWYGDISGTPLTFTITQLTPTIKGTFTGQVTNGTTSVKATITNGVFEGAL